MSETAILQQYARKLTHLRRGVTKYGPAPHKPILLLAVFQGLEEGWISGNRIELTPQLAGMFKTIWNRLVRTGHSPLIAQPFFYMRSERFWHHVPNPGYERWVEITKSCQAIGVLLKAVSHVRLDDDFFELLTSTPERAVLRNLLIEKYFPEAGNDWMGSSYWNRIEKQILSESVTQYQTEIERLERELDKDGFEEDRFVRSGVFKKQVPLIYNNTCCISGLRVETTVNATLVDACHIVPFSESRDDTISNGIALCPTLHRAFDRGLVAVDPESYRVMVSARLGEPVASAYSIRQFQGLKIRLPENPLYRPGRVNLARHLERFADHFR